MPDPRPPTATPQSADPLPLVAPGTTPATHAVITRIPYKSLVLQLPAGHPVRLRQPLHSPRRKEGQGRNAAAGSGSPPLGGSRPACSSLSTFRERGGSVRVNARRDSGLSRQTGRGDHRQTTTSGGAERQRPVIPPPAPVRRAIARCSSLAPIVRSPQQPSDVVPPQVPRKERAKRSPKR